MISPIADASGGSALIEQMRAQAVDRMMKAADANQDGRITESELTQAVEQRGDKQGLNVSELFKQLDQGGKGYLTKQDLVAGLPIADAAGPPGARPPQRPGRGGPPPRGGGAGGAGKSNGDDSTSSAFDPQDLNQDGTVTMQEKIQYLVKAYAASQQESQPQSQQYA